MVSRILPLKLQKACVKKRGKTIIGPIDLEISGDGVTIIMGPNGSGKTTLLRLLHGLERIHSGAMSWKCETKEAIQRQAFVFQTPIMLRRTVFENMVFPLKLRHFSSQKAKTHAAEWLDRVNLTGAAHLNAAVLSGGEKQKLALARALAIKPEILFLDEPTANLDGTSTREIETVLRKSVQDGIKIVMATHDLGQASRLADEILFLYRGLLHDQGDAASFFKQPVTMEASAFIKGEIVE